jgi:hypothetical protein
MRFRLLVALATLSLAVPAVAAAQSNRPGVIVQGTAGTNINVGGNSQSLSGGISFGDHLEVLVSGERIHVPTDVDRFPNGQSVTRHGTTTFISGEVRWAPFTFRRVSPFVLAGAGGGRSKLNVNEHFPDPVSNDARLFFVGGGVRVPVAGGLSVVADLRGVLQVEDNDDASVFLFVPVRAGISWRF